MKNICAPWLKGPLRIARFFFLSGFFFLNFYPPSPKIPGLIAHFHFPELFFRSVFAGQETFPFLAQVKGESVNVRAGQNVNFERLGQLNQGDEVMVVAKEFKWYKIQLPSSANSFVSKEFIQFLSNEAGGVTVDRVNIRAGAGTQHTVIGQLTKGEEIVIKEVLGEWYRIRPVAKSYGWVSEEFLVFKSKDVSGYEAMLVSRPFLEGNRDQPFNIQERPSGSAGDLESSTAQKGPEVKKAQASKDLKSPKVVQGKIISATGYVESYQDQGQDRIQYKIVEAGSTVCYVQGVNHMLGRLLHQRVTVEGMVVGKLRASYSFPVINVIKVRLLL